MFRSLRLLMSVVSLAVMPALFSQKPALDFSVVEKWISLGYSAAISSDGKVVVYDVVRRNQPVSAGIYHTTNKWNLEIAGAQKIMINGDSRYVFYSKKDSLFIYDVIKRNYLPVITGVSSFRIPSDGTGQWLAYHVKDKLTLKDLFKENETIYENVSGYLFSDNGKLLLLQQKADSLQNLQLIYTSGKKLQSVSSRLVNPRNFVFDKTAKQLAFLADKNISGQPVTLLYYFREGMDSAIVRVSRSTPGLKNNYAIATGVLKFSPDGNKLFFPTKLIRPVQKPVENAADLNLWHYKDIDLPAEQEAGMRWDKIKTCMAVICYDSSNMVQISNDEDGSLTILSDKGNGNYALVRRDWNGFSALRDDNVPVYDIVNLKTGERKLLISKPDISPNVSPGGRYMAWYDALENNYYVHDLTTDAKRSITSSLRENVPFVPAHLNAKLKPTLPCGIAGWLPGDKWVLVYDQFDLWKIDPTAVVAPINLTRGYGKKNNIIFRIWTGREDYYSSPEISEQQLLLVAFNENDKSNGFFVTDLSGKNDPEKRSLDASLYYQHPRFLKQFFAFDEMHKATNAPVYLVTRESASEFPNLYVTRDFSRFDQVSNLAPQKEYNWLSTELLNYNRGDGSAAQAVLYKPENFDSSKKYPVIFYFYEKLSHRLHQFLDPELSNGSISIPVYVSNGYLVCTPDIDFRQGETGECILNGITSAARYLSKFNWVDSTRMGLQGHSFAGYGVNYIVSHSNMFAAAQESSGSVDWISHYNSNYRENSAQFYFETGQARLGKTLWEDPQLFIKNSPIFHAPNVNTPLLIMHNKDDGEVPFQQGYEWFTALRRLRKKVWMLQYDKEAHAISQRKNQLDFSIRTMQFFDHYLKGKGEPKWMAKGIPMAMKGVETGLEVGR